MRKLLSASVLAAVIIMLVATTTAYAAMPNGTLVMKDKAYSLSYAAMAQSYTEILQAFQEAGYTLYFKNFAGAWEDTMGRPVQASVIPAVVYKDVDAEPVQYAAGDGDIITGAMATVNYEFSRPGFVYVVTITVNGDDQAAKYCLYDQSDLQVCETQALGAEAPLAPNITLGDTLSVKIMDNSGQILSTQIITVVDGPGLYQYELQQEEDDFRVIDIY